jgi:hypothetical protein
MVNHKVFFSEKYSIVITIKYSVTKQGGPALAYGKLPASESVEDSVTLANARNFAKSGTLVENKLERMKFIGGGKTRRIKNSPFKEFMALIQSKSRFSLRLVHCTGELLMVRIVMYPTTTALQTN